MFFIFEIQSNKDGTGAVLPAITKTSRQEAESEYHRILQFAAISSIYKHGALVITEDCIPVMYNCYEHNTEGEN